MDITIFLTLLFSLTAVSGVVTEAIKKLTKDKENRPTNLIALVVGIVVGIGGVHVWAFFGNTGFTSTIIVCSILMGIASALTSMVGYDKIKQLIEQIGGK